MTNERSHQSRSFVGWLRRRAFPKLAKLCAFIGLMILGLWITGRVLTDQYSWSQYIWWVPALWMLGSAWVCLFVSFVFAKFSRRLGGIFLRPILLVACLGSSIYLFFGVWHMHRIVLPYQQPNGSIRIGHWNHAGQQISNQGWEQSLLDQGVDIVLISNARWGQERQMILNNFAPYAPEEKERWINYSYKIQGDPSHFWVQDNAIIASRYPMIRTGIVSFGSAKRQQLLNHSSSNLGWIMFVEFNLAPIASKDQSTPPPDPIPFVVWLVDLPSDPYNARQESMQKTRDAIDSWNGTGWKMGRHVWEQNNASEDLFPAPDLIIGDFNTIRGSDSIHHLAPNMTDAFDAVGFGRGRSWVPHTKSRLMNLGFLFADWHIDLSFVNAGWKATRYKIQEIDQSGHAEHRMQILDLIEKTPE